MPSGPAAAGGISAHSLAFLKQEPLGAIDPHWWVFGGARAVSTFCFSAGSNCSYNGVYDLQGRALVLGFLHKSCTLRCSQHMHTVIMLVCCCACWRVDCRLECFLPDTAKWHVVVKGMPLQVLACVVGQCRLVHRTCF